MKDFTFLVKVRQLCEHLQKFDRLPIGSALASLSSAGTEFEAAALEDLNETQRKYLASIDTAILCKWVSRAQENEKRHQAQEAEPRTLAELNKQTNIKYWRGVSEHLQKIAGTIDRAKELEVFHDPPFKTNKSESEIISIYGQFRNYLECGPAVFRSLFKRSDTEPARVNWLKRHPKKPKEPDREKLVNMIADIYGQDPSAEQINRYFVFSDNEPITDRQIYQIRHKTKKNK